MISLIFLIPARGYPTKWFDETDIFSSDSSPTIQPKIIPASWFAACMLYHIQAVNNNNFGISETISRDLLDSSYQEEFGPSIYPTISPINHSCDPNTAIEFINKGVVVLYALQPLCAGSEICLPYKPPFLRISTPERQILFQSHYYFKCECVDCINDWNQDNKQTRRAYLWKLQVRFW